ncbi:MAG: cytochrome c3 family protein [Anaerolineae bacterium]
MKKLLLITTLALVLVLAVVGMASANGGPHGGYTATTDACAGCHRAHTATGPKLLIETSTYALCISCHGNAGSGANTNVEDGYYLASRDDAAANGNVGAANTPDNSALLGGGFVNYGGNAVTSSHDPSGATDLAWGNGVARGSTAALAAGNLTCASCHDPHGSANYRIIKATVNGNAVAVAQVDEGAAKDYDTEQWGTGQSNVCAACHDDYHKTAVGQGSILDGASYTHRIDMGYSYGGNNNPETVGMGGYTLPLAETGTNNTVACQTCHLPHGTASTMAGFASGAGPAADSALLRLDNRGVCEVCHQK